MKELLRPLLAAASLRLAPWVSCTLASREGFSVTVCGRGDDAQRLVQNRHFDIALFDLYMSQVSGLELLDKTLEKNPLQNLKSLSLSREEKKSSHGKVLLIELEVK